MINLGYVALGLDTTGGLRRQGDPMTAVNVRAILQRHALFEDAHPVECLLVPERPKICYASKGKAKSAAKEMIESGLKPAEWYQCPGCFFWHLKTSKSPDGTRRRLGLNGNAPPEGYAQEAGSNV
jgi:hypothetical protein